MSCVDHIPVKTSILSKYRGTVCSRELRPYQDANVTPTPLTGTGPLDDVLRHDAYHVDRSFHERGTPTTAHALQSDRRHANLSQLGHIII